MQVKVWDKESIQELLRVNDRAVARAILTLYALQTEDEQAGERTSRSNGVGFNQVDAPFLTSVAKALPRWNNHMTPKQLSTARKMLPKYWRQLATIANEKLAANAGASVEQVIAGRQVTQSHQNPNFGRF